jgi:hypothetical protein
MREEKILENLLLHENIGGGPPLNYAPPPPKKKYARLDGPCHLM